MKDPFKAHLSEKIMIGLILLCSLSALWAQSGFWAPVVPPRARDLRIAASRTWRRLGLMLYDARHYLEALECFQRAVEMTADNDYKFLALVWQGQLLDLMGKRDAAIEAYRAAQATGSTYVFRHDQYKLQIDQNWVQARLQIPFQR